jgi:hypothetical protein
MEIKPHYVNFNTAKLLKEKGLVAKSDRYWVKMTKDSYTEMTDRRLEDLDSDIGIGGNLVITKYQQWQVVEWLLLKYGIWVGVNPLLNNKFFYNIIDLKSKSLLPINSGDESNYNYTSPQEAYSAAFDYIINNNLI